MRDIGSAFPVLPDYEIVTEPPYVKHARFAAMIDGLVDYNKELRQQQHPDVAKIMTASHYMINYGTVWVNVGRQAGATTYIKNKADSNSAVIVHSERMRDEFRRSPTKHGPPSVFVRNSNSSPAGFRLRFQTIYVDQPALIFDSAENLAEFYHEMSYSQDQTFIMLGPPYFK